MMPKRRKRSDTSRESKSRRGAMDYPIYYPLEKRHIMTKEEFRERLMEDLGYEHNDD